MTTASSPSAAFAAPRDVAAMLRRLAGDLYPRTAAPEWAAVIAVVEDAALEIELQQRPTDA